MSWLDRPLSSIPSVPDSARSALHESRRATNSVFDLAIRLLEVAKELPPEAALQRTKIVEVAKDLSAVGETIGERIDQLVGRLLQEHSN